MDKSKIEISNYINSLNNFLYKYLIFNFIINICLYFFSNVNLGFIFYILIVLFFFINIFKIYKSFTPVLFSQILVIFLVNLTYLAFIISYILNTFVFNIKMDYVFEYLVFCDTKTYFLANSYLFIFSLSILFFNNFIPKSLILKVVQKTKIVENNSIKRNLLICIIACISAEFFYFSSGILGTQTTGGFLLSNPDDKSSWFTQLFKFILIFHILLNILYFNSYKKEKLTIFVIIFLIISFFSCFVFFSLFARKAIIMFFLINFFLYFIVTGDKIVTFKKFLVYLFALTIIFQSWNFLSTIRTMSLTQGTMSLKEVIKQGQIFSFYTNPNVSKLGKQQVAVNLSLRVLNNHELASVFYHNSLEEKKHLNGQLLISYIIKAIPKIIYPKKTEHLTGEDLIRTVTSSPLYLTDTVDSYQSASYLDFGLFGLIIYPIIINLILFIVYKIMAFEKLTNFSVIYITGLVIPFITLDIVETSPISWFTLVRNILLFILFFNFLFLLTQKKKL